MALRRLSGADVSRTDKMRAIDALIDLFAAAVTNAPAAGALSTSGTD